MIHMLISSNKGRRVWLYQEVGFVLQSVWKRREGKERHQGIKGSIHSGV